jgi:hypothetical protein
MSDDLNTILNEALPRWAKLTGTKLGANSFSFTIGSDSEFQSYDLKKYVEDLNESRTLDMSGTTTILLLRGLFEAYVEEKSFKVHTLLYAPAGVEKTLATLRSFHELISRPCCEEAASNFKETLRSVAVHHGYNVGRLKKHLADERALGELRLAASRSLNRLATHQFTQGTRDPKPLQYNREIFEFSSINSFIYALRRQMVSGITLALIRPEDVYKAYFVLGLRNGETTTILTDFQEGAHPEYHNMTRRPDRRLDERARLHWFPYRLLEEDAVEHKRRKKTALVPLDAKAMPIEEIANLEPSEFIWLALLFDLIATKFDKDDYKTPALSYTGEMVVAPHALVEATSAIVLTGQYKPLVLPSLTVLAATPELAGNEKPLGHNAWLEDRYRDHVPEILLDVVGERAALDVGKQVTKLLPGKIKDADLPAVRKQPGTFGWGPDRRLEPLVPQALDPSYFGTAKDVERTRAWYARMNLIKGVQRLASAEFAAKHALILSWYRKRIERNMAFIWKAVACGELVAPTTAWKSCEDHGFPSEDELRWKKGNILRQKQAPKYNPFHPSRGVVEFGGWDHDRHYNVCALDPPTRANVFTEISPDNPRALALLMGIPENKLPWPLQHWTTHEPYTGNSILDRIDPQDSRLDDPWRHLDLSISIALSKRAYNRLRKEHELPHKEVQRSE